MSFKITKKQLENSAYYCAAGMDFQPILRFGDIIENFIYVTAGLSKDDFLNGINEFISNIQGELNRNNSSLTLESILPISIEEIEHPITNRLVSGKPDYFSQEDYENYLRSMNQFIKKTDEFYLEICFKLRIGNIEKEIKLFHLSGEGLATYDIIFIKQGIAPKVFISIQTGLIEIPNGFSNRLFELSSAKPKIWLRGVWVKNEDLFINRPEVFSPNGIFNEIIGEYKNWKVDITENIENATNRDKPFRKVKAYAQSSEWIDTKTYSIKKEGLIINKLLGSYNGGMTPEYDLIKLHFPFSKIFEIVNEASDFKKQNNDINRVRIAILPGGYECFEIMLDNFFETYQRNEQYEIEIDVFYVNKSDLRRDFT
jgi:hypothetical protein